MESENEKMSGSRANMTRSARANITKIPHAIEVYGARVHNLKNINVKIPLNKITAIAGVSGSGKSSLALGVLYAEGSRRYLESLSTYTRRRMTEASKALVDEVLYVPASLALHQRPGVPGMRSTFGTGTELLNSLRLLFSRCASHRCPNGHYVPPTLNVAAEQEIVCPECGVHFYGPGAEELAFNSQGACPKCQGTGIVRVVDESTLVPDENLSIDEGAVLPWQTLMWSLMKEIARKMGVRTDVPFKDLTDKEKDIVFHGPAKKIHMIYQMKKGAAAGSTGEMDFTYFNAIYTVENALSNVKDEKGMKRVEKFLRQSVCPDCLGTRLSEKARAPKILGINLAKSCEMTLSNLVEWIKKVPPSLPEEMRQMAQNIGVSFLDTAKRLMDLGLGYLTLDRASSTLSNGERQRMQLARAVRNRTTGVLYVLDEPSIGLHPANIIGLKEVMRDLIRDGNTVVLVDHDTEVLGEADYMIEMGPVAGAEGGNVIAEGTVEEIEKNPKSQIGKYLSGAYDPIVRKIAVDEIIDKNSAVVEQKNAVVEALETTSKAQLVGFDKLNQHIFSNGRIYLETSQIHTVKPLCVDFPKGALSVVTGVSGSGKTTLILESLIPALKAKIAGEKLPPHIKKIEADGISQVKLIDATPIGINVRSTVATYADVHDELRKVFAKTEDAKRLGYKAGDFSYNTGKLRCPTCDGTGQISLDVQFLPDVDIPCPDCKGSRYSKEAGRIFRASKSVVVATVNEVSPLTPVETTAKTEQIKKGDFDKLNHQPTKYSLPELMDMDVNHAIDALSDIKIVKQRLEVLRGLGLGYLTLGEETPSLSGGEAQRLKLASEMGKGQDDTVFVFDEPTIGLHPSDVRTLLKVFQSLIEKGATVIVIEHDLDVIRNADYIVDMGPGGGEEGGEIVVTGSVEDVKNCEKSQTGKFL